MTVDEAKKLLSTGKGSIRCAEVRAILEELGFTVARGKKPKHFMFNHEALDGWWGSNFACPHRSGDPMKKNHVTKIIGVIRTFESELSTYLGESNV